MLFVYYNIGGKNIMLKNLNFFRIWFTITILYGHIMQHFLIPMFPDLPAIIYIKNHISYAFGYMCDMFFIISGFFLFFSFFKDSNFKNFIIKKVARLSPVLLFSLFGFMILSPFIENIHFYKYQNILSVFFIRSSFITNIETNNGAAWYINVMFWGYIFYYSLFNSIPKEKRKYITAIIVFIMYSILINKQNLYDQPQFILDGILTIPMIRALAGMGLGYIIAEFYNSSNCQNSKSIFSKIGYTIIEIITIILLFKFSIINPLSYSFPILTILFIIIFYCFLTKKGYISRFLDNNVVFQLGKYCFSIYMMQDFCFQLLNKFLWNNIHFGIIEHPIFNILAGILFCIIVGIITYYIIEEPCKRLILAKLAKSHQKI